LNPRSIVLEASKLIITELRRYKNKIYVKYVQSVDVFLITDIICFILVGCELLNMIVQ
jgi:hypothetical protein